MNDLKYIANFPDGSHIICDDIFEYFVMSRDSSISDTVWLYIKLFLLTLIVFLAVWAISVIRT